MVFVTVISASCLSRSILFSNVCFRSSRSFSSRKKFQLRNGYLSFNVMFLSTRNYYLFTIRILEIKLFPVKYTGHSSTQPIREEIGRELEPSWVPMIGSLVNFQHVVKNTSLIGRVKLCWMRNWLKLNKRFPSLPLLSTIFERSSLSLL